MSARERRARARARDAATTVAGAAMVFALAWLAAPAVARANPRFAARYGTECIQCHVSPGGGGPRNAYGRNVFERAWLPMFPRTHDASRPLDATDADLEALATDSPSDPDASLVDFAGDLTDWLAIGSDFRLAYLWIRPDRGVTPDDPPSITSSLFLMEAYLYLDARIHENVRFSLTLGPYAGFEAWALVQVDARDEAPLNLYVKAGHFYPTFGVREVEHQLFTREGIGLGNADRDTGVELTGYAGPVTLNLGVFNGTLGGAAFDTFGADRRTFEKAIVARLSVRARLSWLRLQVGASFALNENVDLPNPLFAAVLRNADPAEVARGLNELKTGGFVTANIGPFTYIADLVLVRNHFNSPAVPFSMGYASYQELSWLVTRGLEVVATVEFEDTNVELAGQTALRTGLVVEWFPWSVLELRAMVRRMDNDVSATGGTWDFVLQAHAFL